MTDEKSTSDNKEKPQTWEDHWATGHVPWDAGKSSPSLAHFLSTQSVTAGARALVAGCGAGYDVFALAKAGYEAVGIDLAPSAEPRFHELRSQASLSEDQAQLVVDDFFKLSAADVGGQFDVIWDYTFYCAITPDMRDSWREQMAKLLKPSGTLAMLLFPVVPGAPADQGPPFPLDPEQVTAQLSQQFERLSLEAAPRSHPGREGKEWLSTWQLK